MFKEYVKENNIGIDILEFDQPTSTSQQAADMLGCKLYQIAKSIILKTVSESPVLVITSGVNRVDVSKIEALLNEKIIKADAAFVKDVTGYSIGGVPPFGHKIKIKTFIDSDLANFNEVYSAGGAQNALFKIQFTELVRITDGNIAVIKEDIH